MSYNPLRSKLLGQVPEEDKNALPVYRDTNRLMRVLGFCVFHNNIQKSWGLRSSKISNYSAYFEIPDDPD